MTKEVLQKNLEKALKKRNLLFTRLRTPNYGYRGVRYPADYILWLPNSTILLECKQRKALPIAPSDIRQLPFMQEWADLQYNPKAYYLILTATEEGYCLFSCFQVASSAKAHKGLRLEQSIVTSTQLDDIINSLLNFKEV